jgi:hypothetical protein
VEAQNDDQEVGKRFKLTLLKQMRSSVLFLAFFLILVAKESPAGSLVSVRPAESDVRSQETPAPISTTLDIAEKVARLLAYLVGAAWVYFNFFKGRTYRPRLEAKVLGELSRRGDPELVRAIIQLKNVGLGKVDIQKRGTALRVLAFDQSVKGNWRHISTLPILEHHAWIEPNELVEEQTVWPIDLKDIPAVRLEVIVTGRKTMWEASTIAM